MRRLARPLLVTAAVDPLAFGGTGCGDEDDPTGEPAPSDVTGNPVQGDPRGNNSGDAGDAGTSGAGGAGDEPSTGAGGGGP